MLVGSAACGAELSTEERQFYRRSANVNLGEKSEIAARELGQPSRVNDVDRMCAADGAQKEWIYESIDTPRGRIQLRGGSLVLCIDDKGVIVGKLNVYQ